MMRRLGFYLSGAVAAGALCALAGCGGHNMFAEREPWRREAELQCLNSGAVKEGPGKVRISPIEGPGACGSDFPFKVSSLGSSAPLSYVDDPRPPAAIPNGAGTRWPIAPLRPAAPIVTQDDLPPLGALDEPRPTPGSRHAAPPAPSHASPPRSDRPLAIDPPGMRERAGASPPGRTPAPGAPYRSN